MVGVGWLGLVGWLLGLVVGVGCWGWLLGLVIGVGWGFVGGRLGLVGGWLLGLVVGVGGGWLGLGGLVVLVRVLDKRAACGLRFFEGLSTGSDQASVVRDSAEPCFAHGWCRNPDHVPVRIETSTETGGLGGRGGRKKPEPFPKPEPLGLKV